MWFTETRPERLFLIGSVLNVRLPTHLSQAPEAFLSMISQKGCRCDLARVILCDLPTDLYLWHLLRDLRVNACTA